MGEEKTHSDRETTAITTLAPSVPGDQDPAGPTIEFGIDSIVSGDDDFAIYGRNTSTTSTSGFATGVRGDANAPVSFGVIGIHFALAGGGIGVRGDSSPRPALQVSCAW